MTNENGKDYEVDPNNIKDLVTSGAAKKQFALALPKHLTVDRFLRVALTAFNKTPQLLACSKESLTECLMSCSELGLEPDGRRAHLIPYRSKKTNKTICTLIIDYKGLVALARRSGEIADIHADVVCENDFFAYSFGTNGNLEHRPAIDKKGNVIAAYSFVKLKDGSTSYEVMNIQEVEAIRKRSQAATKGPWVTDWNEMAKKTVFRRHSKWLPVSAEFRDAVDKDYDVPIDIMRSAEVVGKPEVEQPKSLSDKPEPEPEPKPEPEKKDKPKASGKKGKKSGAPEIESEKDMSKKKPDSAFAEMIKDFENIKATVGDKVYYEVLGANGCEHANQIKTIKEGAAIIQEMLQAKKDGGEEREPGSEG